MPVVNGHKDIKLHPRALTTHFSVGHRGEKNHKKKSTKTSGTVREFIKTTKFEGEDAEKCSESIQTIDGHYAEFTRNSRCAFGGIVTF